MSSLQPVPRQPFYDVDTYWKDLVRRVYEKEDLQGNERLFYRLSVIRGYLGTQGIVEYIENNFQLFDDDLRDLDTTGFTDIANTLREARDFLIGDAVLDQDSVDRMIDDAVEWLDDSPAFARVTELETRLRPRLADLQHYCDQLGLREGYYKQLES